MSTLTNADTTLQVLELGIKKGEYSIPKTFSLGFLGGFYVALASFANLVALHYIGGGMGRFIGSTIFPIALMLVVLVGGSLFTGDALGWLAVAEKKVQFLTFVNNLVAVWLGNFAGAMFLVALIFYGDSCKDVAFTQTIVKVAEHKLHLTITDSLISGFLCNILVAMGVWFALTTKDFVGKVLAIWFPVMLFVFSGFQHVVANMFYINLGLMLQPNAFFAAGYVNHFVFVSIGNFLSGAIFLPLVYRDIYIKQK